MLVSLQKLGFSIEPPDVVALSRACRTRLAVKCPGIRECWGDLLKLTESSAICYARVVDPRG
eukprot:2012483-Pyramimonas_sp.AAC.1